MVFQKLNPFAKPKTKPKPQGVLDHLGNLVDTVVTETVNIPTSIIQTGAQSVGVRLGTSHDYSSEASANHSDQVKQFLYGSSLNADQKEVVQQKQLQEQTVVPNEIEEQRRRINEFISFKNRRAQMEASSYQQPMSIQEEQEREEQQKRQLEAQEAEKKKRFATVALPGGVSKKPGMAGMVKKKRGDQGRMELGKGT